jgi:hypothetical protein
VKTEGDDMTTKRRIRLTYANVVASIALFAALGGSSYAAISITGKQVRDGSLAGRDVRNGSLTSGDVRDQTLLARDFKAGQLAAGPKGERGAAGPQGPIGPQGLQGERGLPGVAAYEIVFAESQSNSDSPKVVSAKCPTGKRAIGGGESLFGLGHGVTIYASYPLADGSGWSAEAEEDASIATTWSVGVYAVCAKVG